MSDTTITITLDGLEPDQAGLYAQQLRDAIFDAAPTGVDVSLRSSRPDSLQFGETIIIEVAAAVLAHGIIKTIEHFVLQSSVTLRVVKKANEVVEVVLDQVRPDSVKDLQKLLTPKGQ
jgi:hypothetical protein